MAREWSTPIILKSGTNELAAGQSIPVETYHWAGRLSAGQVYRWGFRTIQKLTPEHFQIEFLDADGNLVSKQKPSLRSTPDSDGLQVAILEATAPPDCRSARLRGRRTSGPAEMIGPTAHEKYSEPSKGATLGAPMSIVIPPGQGSVLLEALTVSGTDNSPAQFAIQFHASDGSEIMPSASTSVSPIIGSYVVMSKVTSTGWVHAPISLPEGTASITVASLKSKADSAIAASLRMRTRSRSVESLDAFLKELPADTSLIFIDSTAPPLGSGLITIRPNNMAIQYTSLGYAVVSIGYGGLQGVDRRPYELFYQAPRDEFGEVIERIVGESRHRECLYVCSSFPSPSAVVAVDTLKRANWKTLYEIRDDMEEFKRVGYSKWYTAEGESLICRRVDHVTAVSPALADKASALSLRRAKPVVIPNGIQPRFIAKAAPLRSLDVVEKKRRAGIVGYVGHLTDAWFDWDYFLRCAEALPMNDFQIIGPGKPDTLRLPENVTYLGPRKQEELQDLTSGWAVGLVPFKKSPLTRAVDPNKLFEYVAWGMRTVAAEMGSIDDCPTAASYHTFEQMLAAIEQALARPWTQIELDRAEAYLRNSTWRRRAEQTLEVVGL